MMLDILFWKTVNPNVKYTSCKKRFYGKYLYKVVLRIDGVTTWQIRNQRFQEFKSLADLQQRYLEDFNESYNGLNQTVIVDKDDGMISYASTTWKSATIRKIDTHRLWTLIQFKQKYGIHSSISHPEKIVLFSNDQRLLWDITIALNPLPDDIIEFSAPRKEDMDALNAGAQISPKATKFKYKCYFRDFARYSRDDRHRIINYLDALGDEVEVPRFTEQNIRYKNPFQPNLYFYCNDKDLPHFLNIIKPKCVSRMQLLMPPGK